jgi:DMATS type aromatic prenyltransferase
MLTEMLTMAGYNTQSKKIHADFFRESVAPSLGFHPRGTGVSKLWKSFMTDDHTPVELSWCWSTSTETPTVRYSVEPIGKDAGWVVDPINTAASVQLLGEALPLAPDMDLYLHRHFQKLLLTRNLSAHSKQETIIDIPQAQSFIAFDLLETSIVVKQYYLPARRALVDGSSSFAIVKNAIQKLPAPSHALLTSFDVLINFFESFTVQSRPSVEIMAIDYLDPTLSRLKIYVRSRATTLQSVIEMMTLRGKYPKTSEEENSLRELWCSVFGLNGDGYDDHHPLPEKEHRTGGILYYFELKCGATFPKTKVYLPVRHYAQNDDQIARGLSKYLDRRDKKLATGSYYNSVKKLWCVPHPFIIINYHAHQLFSNKHRELVDGLGFHTYISWASDRNQWNITAYLNPEIYHLSRSKQGVSRRVPINAHGRALQYIG